MSEAQSAPPGTTASAGGPDTPKPRRSAARIVALTVAGIALAVGFHHGLDYIIEVFTHESTDDAFLETHIVAVAPRVAGQVQAVRVKDNQWVKEGDGLVELDPRDYAVRQSQKRAATASATASLDSARAGLDLMQARSATAEATSRQEHANAESARAKAARAQADLKRTENLRDTGVVSVEEFDRVRADADSATADLKAAEQKAAAAASQVAEAKAQFKLAVTVVASAATKVEQARTDERAADLDLSYTKILTPCDGKVTRKSIEPGAYVQVGQSLLALVPNDFHVVANFKESELTDLRPGQPAEIRIDAYPQRRFRGHVDSFMAGSGARFSLLPPENAVGNYVKIVQRVPVKIVFDEPLDPAMSLGPGMSVVPHVRVNAFTAAPLLVWLGAIVLAILTTLGLSHVIGHFRD